METKTADAPTDMSFVELATNGAPSLPAVVTHQAPIAAHGSAAPPSAPVFYPAKIAKSLIEVTKKVGPVGKIGLNKFHGYHYQRWEDVLAKISVLLPEHGLIISQTEVSRSLFDNDKLLAITYQFSIINEDGEVWPERPRWSSISRLVDSKGIYDDKAANKCHTQAHKYFLLHLFKIRTPDANGADSDADGRTEKRPPSAAAAANAPEAGVDPETGEIGPYAIDLKGKTFQQFANLFVAAIKTSRSAEELQEWCDFNDAALSELAEKRKTISAEIDKAHDEVTTRFGVPKEETAPAEQKTSTSRRPPSASAHGLGQSQQSKDVQAERQALYEALLAEIEKLAAGSDVYEWQKGYLARKRGETLTPDQRLDLGNALNARLQKLNRD